MKFIKVFVLFLLTFFYWVSTNAQSPATGCLLANNIVYTDDYTFTIYYKTSSVSKLPVNMCSWTPLTGPTCYVSASRSFNINCFCFIYDSPQPGIRGTFTASAIECPIDNYIPHMALGISILGFIYIRKKNILHSA